MHADKRPRSSIVVAEKVSMFAVTPPQRYKRKVYVHELSGSPTALNELPPCSEGISRIYGTLNAAEGARLSEDPVLCGLFTGLFTKMMGEINNLKDEINNLKDLVKVLPSLLETKKKWERMESLVELRSLIEAWEKTEDGKIMKLGSIVNKTNQQYQALQAKKKTAWRKCRSQNLFFEIKALLTEKKEGSKSADTFLDVVRGVVEEVVKLPGMEFIDLLHAYQTCNESVHMTWSEDVNQFQAIVEKAREGSYVINGRPMRAWILKIARDFSRRRRWGNLGITDMEIGFF